jgi:NTE family protein
MKNMNHFIGTSIGALIALVCATGQEQHIFQSFLEQYDSLVPKYSLATLNKSYGFNDMTNMRSFILKLLPSEKTTFRDLYERYDKRRLTVCATSVRLKRPVYFNHQMTPHVRVLDAVLASMAIPVLFTPVKINNEWYIDGGVTCHFPIEQGHPETTLGIYLKGAERNATLEGKNASSLISYLFFIFDVVFFGNEDVKRNLVYSKYKVIDILFERPMGVMELRQKKDALIHLFNTGYQTNIE